MKPQDFVKEFNRMCESNREKCKGCKFVAMCSCNLLDIRPEEFAQMYDAIAEWSDTHPVKTRQSEFLKLFPNAVIDDDDGILGIKPCYIDERIGCTDEKGCDGCRRKYWLAEVPDND